MLVSQICQRECVMDIYNHSDMITRLLSQQQTETWGHALVHKLCYIARGHQYSAEKLYIAYSDHRLLVTDEEALHHEHLIPFDSSLLRMFRTR